MRSVLDDGPLSHLPSMSTFARPRTRFLVFDDKPHHISACLVCMFLPLLYPSQRYPLFYLCTLYCCLYFLFLLLFSFVLFIWQGASLLSLSLFGLSLVSCLPFSGYRISCGLRRKQPPPHINYIAFAGVITWERSHYIAHLISWLVHRSNAHLSHSSFGHLISWYGREIAGFRPSGIFSHPVGNLGIEPRGALSVLSEFFFLGSLPWGTLSLIRGLLLAFTGAGCRPSFLSVI